MIKHKEMKYYSMKMSRNHSTNNSIFFGPPNEDIFLGRHLSLYTCYKYCKYIHINSTLPQDGIDPPAQSHASYEASALPPSHYNWMIKVLFVT